MDTKVAIMSIIVESNAIICDIQNLLSEHADYIIGRFGIPHTEKNIRIISVVLDAPVNIINNLTSKIQEIENVNVHTMFSNI